MAIRSEVVRPDSVLVDMDGREVPVVSREAMIDAAIRAVDVMMLAGGEFTMSSQRVPTGWANESVSTVGFLTWRSGTVGTTKPSPEHHDAPPAPTASERRALAQAQREFDESIRDAPDEDAEPPDDEADLDEADVEDHVPTAAQ